MSDINAVPTILFVENDPVSLTMYRNRLDREGFTVKAAVDGLDAMKSLSTLVPDLVVLDLMLPRMSGAEVLKHMRADSRLKNVPVLVFSNAAMGEWPKDVAAGATRCMCKSESTFPMLLQSVQEMLAEAGPTVAPLPTSGSSQVLAGTAETATDKQGFVTAAISEISRLRDYSLCYIKSPGSETGKQQLARLHLRVQVLTTTAERLGCNRFAMLAKAFHALLGDVISKPSWVTPSILHTLAQAVDCMGFLLDNGEAEFDGPLPKARVLAVDDDAICNHVVVTTLRRANFDIASVEKPLAALQLAEENSYDVILLDVNMPELTGFEMCEKLRRLSHCRTTPVIFITAFNNFENRKQSVLSGGHDFITKPVSPWELALKVTIHLVRSQVQKTSVVQPDLEPSVRKAADADTAAATVHTTAEPPSNSSGHSLVLATTQSSTTSMEHANVPVEVTTAENQFSIANSEDLGEETVSAEENGLVSVGSSTLKMASFSGSDSNGTNMEVFFAERTSLTTVATEGSPSSGTSSVQAGVSGRDDSSGCEPSRSAPANSLSANGWSATKATSTAATSVIAMPSNSADSPLAIPTSSVLGHGKDSQMHLSQMSPSAPAPQVKPRESAVALNPDATQRDRASSSQSSPCPAEKIQEATPIDSPQNHLMKQETTPVFDRVVQEVARIIFGDHNLTELNVRLVRMALERHNVHEIVKQPPAA